MAPLCGPPPSATIAISAPEPASLRPRRAVVRTLVKATVAHRFDQDVVDSIAAKSWT